MSFLSISQYLAEYSIDVLLFASDPVAGEPEGHVSNSHASVQVVGVVVDDPVPDWFSAGADKTT